MFFFRTEHRGFINVMLFFAFFMVFILKSFVIYLFLQCQFNCLTFSTLYYYLQHNFLSTRHHYEVCLVLFLNLPAFFFSSEITLHTTPSASL